ncbi:MAG: type IV conjugative transfer system protein TraE [Methylophilaceae bacterium]
MKITKLTHQAAAATGVAQWVIVMFTLSQAAIVVLLIVFMTRGDTHRETLVPPVIHRSFWVEDDAVSKEYLIEMGVFVAQIYYDVTPANVDFNHRILKTYVDPVYYGQFETEAAAFSTRIKADNASTTFSIATVVPDEKNKRIALTGLLNTYLGDNRTSSINKTYIFEFGLKGGKILLKGTRETINENKPFEEINKKPV